MNEQKIKYIRLPGRVWVPMNVQRPGTLWLAPDHILTVQEYGYAENYKRFYLSDIQGFIVRRTARRMILNFIAVIVLLAIGGFTLAVSDAGTALAATALFGSPLWIGILINSLYGPTCEVRVRTAVQTEVLAPIQRISIFEKFFTKVKPLIVAAQGEINPEAAGGMAAYAAPSLDSAVPPPLRPFSPRLHLWFFGTLVASCLPGFLLMMAAHPATAMAYYSSVVIAVVLSIAALVRQHSEKCNDGALKSLGWVGGILVFLSAMLHYFEMVAYQFSPEHMKSVSTQYAILKVDPSESDFLFWHISIFLFLACGIGLFGLLRAWQLRPISASESAANSDVAP